MGSLGEINILSASIATVIGAILTFWLTRISKGGDARAAAEAALFNSSPTIIAEQNKRIAGLQTEMDRLWGQLNEVYTRERECQDQLQECRHQVRDLGQKIVALEFKLGRMEKDGSVD